MTLAKGDPLRYRALKEGPVSEYLLALDNFVPKAPPPPVTAPEVPDAKPTTKWPRPKR